MQRGKQRFLYSRNQKKAHGWRMKALGKCNLMGQGAWVEQPPRGRESHDGNLMGYLGKVSRRQEIVYFSPREHHSGHCVE